MPISEALLDTPIIHHPPVSLSQVLCWRRGRSSSLQTDPRTDSASVMVEAARKPKGEWRADQEQKVEGLGEFSSALEAGKAS